MILDRNYRRGKKTRVQCEEIGCENDNATEQRRHNVGKSNLNSFLKKSERIKLLVFLVTGWSSSTGQGPRELGETDVREHRQPGKPTQN